MYLKLIVCAFIFLTKIEDVIQKLRTEIKSKAQPLITKTDSIPILNITEDYVVIYNRVPKTGSTSFVGVVYDLCKKNKYHALHINITNNMHTLTLPNQVKIFILLFNS